uniref:RRM domain-containing protein n=1 Tax=Accipiter nisus TaxID=211598 RepID=A0A8B9NE48_9AVES
MNSGGIGVPLGFPLGPTSVIQVTNLSSAVTSEQMQTLFGFLGDIEELRQAAPPGRCVPAGPTLFVRRALLLRERAARIEASIAVNRGTVPALCSEMPLIRHLQ